MYRKTTYTILPEYLLDEDDYSQPPLEPLNCTSAPFIGDLSRIRRTPGVPTEVVVMANCGGRMRMKTICFNDVLEEDQREKKAPKKKKQASNREKVYDEEKALGNEEVYEEEKDTDKEKDSKK